MRNLGIGFTIFLLPVGLLLGSVAVLSYMTLWSAILLKGPDQLFKHSVDKTTVELLYLPVPTGIKAAVKSFIDTVVWRLADGIGGILLLVLTTLAAFNTRQITVVNMLLLGVWLAIAYSTKKEYLEALRSAVSMQLVDPHKLTMNIQESSAVKSLITSLESRDVDEVLYVLKMMDFFKDKRRLIPKVLRLLNHESAEIRVKALRLVYEVGDRRLAEHVRPLLNDESFEVQVAAVEFLCAHAGKSPVEMTQAFLDDPSYRVKGATACFLILSRGEEEYYVVAREILEKLAHSPDPSARLEAARALGHLRTSPDLAELLLTLLEDPSTEVVQQALQSAGEVQRRDLVPLIIARLGSRDTTLQARRALVKYGAKVLGTLRDYLLDDQTELAVRRAIPRVISRIGSQLAVDILLNHLHEVAPELRLTVIKGLNKLRAQSPELRFDAARIREHLIIEAREYYQSLALLQAYNPTTRLPAPQQESDDLLQRALEEKSTSIFERIFRLLGLIYPPEDLHQAYQATLSPEATVKANALELLDNLLRTDDKHLALPIADDEITMSGKMRVATSLGVAAIEGRIAALSRLVADSEPTVVGTALDAIYSHRLESLYFLIEQATDHADPLVRETALDLWSHIQQRRDTQPHSTNGPLLSVNGQRGSHTSSGAPLRQAGPLSGGLPMRKITTLDKIKRLQKTILFAHSRTDQLISISAIAEEITFNKGDVVFRENDPGDSLFLIVKGKVRLKREGTAYEMIMAEGETFGTLAILDRKPRLVTATAEEETLVLKIDSEEFYELLADHIEMVQGIFSCLSQQIRKFLQTGELELAGKGGAL
jgi:HEAT repeat protein